MLIASNLLVAGAALGLGMGLAGMLLVYWAQSVIIGVCAVVRILCMRNFPSTGPIEQTLKFRIKQALGFVSVYGVLHATYMAFLVYVWRVKFDGPLLGYALCIAVFVANHGYSLYVNLRADAAGNPGPAALTMLPFVRIVPMHIAVLVGMAEGAMPVAIALFLFYKITLDVIMHNVEHKALRARKPGEVYIS